MMHHGVRSLPYWSIEHRGEGKPFHASVSLNLPPESVVIVVTIIGY